MKYSFIAKIVIFSILLAIPSTLVAESAARKLHNKSPMHKKYLEKFIGRVSTIVETPGFALKKVRDHLDGITYNRARVDSARQAIIFANKFLVDPRYSYQVGKHTFRINFMIRQLEDYHTCLMTSVVACEQPISWTSNENKVVGTVKKKLGELSRK